MIIKYDPEEIVLVQPPIINEGEENTVIFNPDYSIDDLGYYEDGSGLAKVFGDLAQFKLANAGIQYEELTEFPRTGVEYYVDTRKAKRPSSADEIFKQKARDRIDSEVGDIYDIVTDVSNRLVMAERLLLLLTYELKNATPDNLPIVTEKYGNMIDQYILVNTNTPQLDTVDLEDPSYMFNKLIERSMKITKIVNDEYITKRDKPE